ncbi:NUDIX domain-containing protein [Microbacterium sp. A93]|uniref:NUDIX domain-containing protein n=1 Tax=Microbacterium sp. A93 TaxID=3450716 RepID=UPI003F432921
MTRRPERSGPGPAPYTGHDGGPVADVPAPRPVVRSETAFSGAIWDVTRESFRMAPAAGAAPEVAGLGDAGDAGGTDGARGTDGAGDTDGADLLVREFIRHPGAVAVVALDGQDRVRMIRQYRHPVGEELWEIPAGLLDVPGEAWVDAARRELAEETDLRAERWEVLTDFYTTPGSSSEGIRVFLARGLSEVPADERHERTGEEAGMPLAWVPVEEAVQAVLDGRLHNPSLVVGLLALSAHRARGNTALRPADSPWHGRPSRA